MVVPRGLLNFSYKCIVTYVVSYRVTDKKLPYLVVLKHVILHNFYKSIVLGNYVVVGVNNIDKRNNVVEEIIIMINITMSSSVVIIMIKVISLQTVFTTTIPKMDVGLNFFFHYPLHSLKDSTKFRVHTCHQKVTLKE